jgi:acetyltransferase-like isoleucine patch superfamily enzyme
MGTPNKDFLRNAPHKPRGIITINQPTFIEPSVSVDFTDNVTIGEGVTISEQVIIYTHDHYHNKSQTHVQSINKFGIKHSPLIIEDDVYIGARCIILEKCHKISKGAVIGAGSIVTKDVPEYEIWAGNPAKKIGERK